MIAIAFAVVTSFGSPNVVIPVPTPLKVVAVQIPVMLTLPVNGCPSGIETPVVNSGPPSLSALVILSTQSVDISYYLKQQRKKHQHQP